MALFLVFALAAAGLCGSFAAQQRSLADKLIRFHVVASSDRAEDQQNKLAVRDALLRELAPLSAQAASREEMLALLGDALPRLEQTARSTLQRLGADDAVSITLAQEPFPTRYYDTFALPAGTYTSLRVRLGAAEGHNWWCVCFPSLCSAACAEEFGAVAAGAGFTDEEIDLMTDSEHYVIRFKVLEWLEQLRHRG